MKAPMAPAAITSRRFCSPRPAATPPMMTVVSLGTIGTTESSRAITVITIRNHQAPETSVSHPVRSPIHPELSAASTTVTRTTLPTGGRR